MRIVVEKYLDLGYPETPDDGTWDSEGGFVGRRQGTMWVMDPDQFYRQRTLIVDRETYEEIKLLIPAI